MLQNDLTPIPAHLDAKDAKELSPLASSHFSRPPWRARPGSDFAEVYYDRGKLGS